MQVIPVVKFLACGMTVTRHIIVILLLWLLNCLAYGQGMSTPGKQIQEAQAWAGFTPTA